MLGSTILETAIGLVFVYLIFSLIASAVAEYFAAMLDRRGEHLKHMLFNLFDNDDPQGRAFLNLFVGHPMIQALQSTDWKPTFRSAEERVAEVGEKLVRAGGRWNLAAKAVAAASAARQAATRADGAAATTVTASTSVEKTRKALIPANPTTVEALQSALTAAVTTAARAEAAAADARRTAIGAREAAQNAAKPPVAPSQTAGSEVPENQKGTAAARPDQSSQPDASAAPAGAPVQPTGAPANPPPATAPTPAPTTAEALAKSAEAVVKRASTAAATAKDAAADARKAAAQAEKAKRGLSAELIRLVAVPKYIPDRTFTEVVLHVLTADETLEALADDAEGEAPGAPAPGGATTSFWDRLSAVLGVVQGVASRLPDSDAKAKVGGSLANIDESLKAAREGTAVADAVLGELEKGTNELRGAVAAVPDDALRAALEREIGTSLLPLQALGRDILTLQRAGQAVALMADSSIKTALSAFLAQAGEDLDAFRRSVGSWYNDVMDHATGWYKRNTQRILALIALVLCTLNNVDTVSLVGHLSTNPELRAAASTQARSVIDASLSSKQTSTTLPAKGGDLTNPQVTDAESAARYKAALEATRLPLWWTRQEWHDLWYTAGQAEGKAADQAAAGAARVSSAPVQDQSPASPKTAINAVQANVTGGSAEEKAAKGAGASDVSRMGSEASTISHSFAPNLTLLLSKLTGLTLSILAVSMGAPFWFDLLNKLVNVRLVGKRPDPTVDNAPPASPPTSVNSVVRASA
jgi:hypothetical protein